MIAVDSSERAFYHNDVSEHSLIVCADSPLQQQMAQAMIALVAEIESEGRSKRGVYRLKLDGCMVTASFERFHRAMKIRLPQIVVE